MNYELSWVELSPVPLSLCLCRDGRLLAAPQIPNQFRLRQAEVKNG